MKRRISGFLIGLIALLTCLTLSILPILNELGRDKGSNSGNSNPTEINNGQQVGNNNTPPPIIADNGNENINSSTETDNGNDDEYPDRNVILVKDLSDGFFTEGIDHGQLFDFSTENPDFSYNIGTDDDELLFAQILSGEKSYKSYLSWFAYNPDYIYRFNEERLKCIGEIINSGSFTEELREKYLGLYVADATYPYMAAIGKNGVSYQIYFNDDWSVKSIEQTLQYNKKQSKFESWFYSLGGYIIGEGGNYERSGEIKQLNRFFKPTTDNDGKFNGYFMNFVSLIIDVIMPDGRECDCNVSATYKQELTTQSVWNGEKQRHEKVTFLSECNICVDTNNAYSNGAGGMFDEIWIFTELDGIFSLEKVWEYFREQALTPSLNLYPTSEQKIIILE